MAKTTKAPFVRNPYNYDTNEASAETALVCEDEHLAQQSFAEESDINYIADKFGLTGELPNVLQVPTYGDFTGIFDFQTAQNAVVLAKQQFMTLPAKLRTRFDNDPQKLMAFLDNPDNREEAEFLGLVKRPETPLRASTVDPVAPSDPATPATAAKPTGETTKPDKKTKSDT